MFTLDKFTNSEFLCLFMGQTVLGKYIYYIVDERIWHNAVSHAIQCHQRAPRYTRGVYSFTKKQEAQNLVAELLEQKQVA